MPTLNTKDFYNKLEVDNKLKDLLKDLRGYSTEKTKDYYNKPEIDNKLESILANVSNKYINPNIIAPDMEIVSGRYDISDPDYVKPTYIKLLNLGNIPGKNSITYLSKEYDIKDYIDTLEKCITPSNFSYGYVLNTTNNSKHLLNSSLYSRSTEAHSLTFYNLVWSSDTSIIFYWNQFTVDSFVDLYLQVEYTKTTDEAITINDIPTGNADFNPDDYYTKEEITEILNNLVPEIDLSNYVTKDEISIGYYTKEEIDNLFNNISLNDYYTKEEIDTYINIKSYNSGSANPIINRIGKLDDYNRYFQHITFGPAESLIVLNEKNEMTFAAQLHDNQNTIVDILRYTLLLIKNVGSVMDTGKDLRINLSGFYMCDDGSVFKLYHDYNNNIIFSVMGQGDNFNLYTLRSLEVEYTGIPHLNYVNSNPFVLPVDCNINVSVINNWNGFANQPIGSSIVPVGVVSCIKGDEINVSSFYGPNPIYIYRNNVEVGMVNINENINNLALYITGRPTKGWSGIL